MKRPYTFNHATVGGTFDRLHAGHMMLLSEAFRIAKHVTVAITSDNFPRNKHYERIIQSYADRVAEVSAFLQHNALSSRATIIRLDDAFGPAPRDATMDAIVVTRETYGTAKRINELRKNAHLAPLHIQVLSYVKGIDSRIIRSSRIRLGEVNRVGYPYATPFQKHITLSLPESLRSTLRYPLGTVVAGTDATRDETAAETVRKVQAMKAPHIITVGDIVYESLGKAGLKPDVAIIDNRNNRKELHTSDHRASAKMNKAGTLMPGAIAMVKKAFRELGSSRNITITIRGEEDLLALPAILFAPLDTLVIYGQYQKGIVIVKVTEEIKEAVRGMVEQFL